MLLRGALPGDRRQHGMRIGPTDTEYTSKLSPFPSAAPYDGWCHLFREELKRELISASLDVASRAKGQHPYILVDLTGC